MDKFSNLDFVLELEVSSLITWFLEEKGLETLSTSKEPPPLQALNKKESPPEIRGTDFIELYTHDKIDNNSQY